MLITIKAAPIDVTTILKTLEDLVAEGKIESMIEVSTDGVQWDANDD